MKRPDDRSRRFLSLLVVVGSLQLGVACTATQDAKVPRAPSSTAALEVMTPDDKARLEALTKSRLSEGRDFEYRIGPDDLIEVQVPDLMDTASMRGAAPMGQGASIMPVVAQAPTYQQGLRVDSDGNIILPFIGAVHAEGRSPAELQHDIAQRLRQAGILRDPQVGVRVVEYRSRVAAVVGSVQRPGLYPLTRPGATVGDLIWAAGGPTVDAGRVVEFAPAGDASGLEPMRLDFAALLRANGLRDPSIDPPVRKGDVITVSPAGSVLVDGWVAKPGSYPATRGLTVSGAVAAAGGDLYPADLRHATVARAGGSGTQEPIPVDLEAVAQGTQPDMPITDGDIVRVPASTARLVPYGAWTLVRDIFRVGGSVVAY
jgi:polysaccharide export outer membrane protein